MRHAFPLILLIAANLCAQSTNSVTGSGGRPGLWNCKFADGNYYSVSLMAIDSVSQHEYLLDGAMRVVEVTVATRGSTQARFYVLEKPSTSTGSLPGQSIADGIGRATEEIVSRGPGALKAATNSVVKKFPETSHAKIIEYRISSRESLTKLFQHLLNRWQGRSSDDTYDVSD
ncbi:MAG: hypothetical protein EBT77_00055 [Verrucomicrobia bacterium]|nr:hypothetical protein [Verrucomicrobiota bacterium]